MAVDTKKIYKYTSEFILFYFNSSNPKYGPRSELGNNMYTYLKFGLPRVLAPRGGGSSGMTKDNSSGYDSTDEEMMIRARSVPPPNSGLRAAR